MRERTTTLESEQQHQMLLQLTGPTGHDDLHFGVPRATFELVRTWLSAMCPSTLATTIWPKPSFEAATREVFVSQAFEMHETVPACVIAINCALQGYEKARSIDELSNGQELKRSALELGKNKYTWGLLSTNYSGTYVEPRKRRF
jgi:hypothetical protein